MRQPYAKDMTHEEQVALYSANARKIGDAITSSKVNINFGFLDIKEHNIRDTHMLPNQIVVIYRNGRMETLPLGVNGSGIKEYLGVMFSRIMYWSALPSPGHDVFKQFKTVRRPIMRKLTSKDIYGHK